MPAIVIALIAALALAVATLVGRVLMALGIAYVSYKGINMLLDQIVNGFFAGMGGLPSQLSAYVSMLRLPTAISIITGAMAAKFAIGGLRDGSLTRMIIK